MIAELRDPVYMTTAEIDEEIVHLYSQKLLFEDARKMMEQMPRAFASYQNALEQSYLPDFEIITSGQLLSAVMQIYIRMHGAKFVQFTDTDMAAWLEKFGYRLSSNEDHAISRYDLKGLVNDDKFFTRYQLQDNSILLCPLQAWIDLCSHVIEQKSQSLG